MPNTAQDGFVRQAAAVAGSSNAVADTGRCEIAMNAASASGMSAAKTSWNRAGVDRHLYAAVGQLRRAHERAHRERREARLEVVDRLALVGRDAGDVDEPGDLLRAAGDRDHSAAVRMADEDGGAVDLVDDRRGAGSVVREPAERVRRRENGVTVTDEPVVHRPPAGRVSERAVNENDCRTRHDVFLSFRGSIGTPVAVS